MTERSHKKRTLGSRVQKKHPLADCVRYVETWQVDCLKMYENTIATKFQAQKNKELVLKELKSLGIEVIIYKKQSGQYVISTLRRKEAIGD